MEKKNVLLMLLGGNGIQMLNRGGEVQMGAHSGYFYAAN